MHTMIVRPGFAFCVVALMQTLGFAPAARAEAVSAETFVQKVANSDLFEIQSGQLVAQKAEDSDTKSFGARMVTDHQKTTQELKGLVEGAKIKAPLPEAVDQDHKANLDKLGGLSGTDFDSNYAAMQVKAHEDAIALFEDYAKSGDNADLKQWAQKTLPTLKEHLDHAKKLASNQKRAGL